MFSNKHIFLVVIFATTLLILFSSSFSVFVNAQLSAARAILAEREASLGRLVERMESLELQRCSRMASWSKTSETCNTPSCGNTFSTTQHFKCSADYGTDANTCDNCADLGLIRSVNRSTVLFAPNTDFNNVEVQGFLSYGQPLEEDWRRERETAKAWMGVATYTGASRWFPGSPRGRTSSSCSSYEPRQRSWYIAGSSGPKDIVIVVDVSGSMSNKDCSSSCPNRLQLMQSATKKLLDTFTFNDYFAIVSFQSTGAIITNNGNAGLIQATQANIRTAKAAVDALYAYGGTNFESGFQKAFAALQATSEGTSNCKRIIMFLTDGIAGDGTTIDAYISGQQATLGSRNASIFTYSMSTGADHTIPRRIACDNGGVWASINNGVNPLNAMAQYYKFLARGINTSQTRFTESYIDAFGLGVMTTGARPIYLRQAGKSPVFVGVADIDIPLAELTKYVTETQIDSELATRGATCPSYNITHCDLQLLRSEAGYQCPSGLTLDQCRSGNNLDEVVACTSGVSGGVNSMLCDSLDANTMISSSGATPYDEVVCCECGLAPGAIAGIVIGSVVGVALIGGGIFFLASGSAAAAGGAGVGVASASSAAAASSGVGASSSAGVASSGVFAPGVQPATNFGNQGVLHAQPSQAFGNFQPQPSQANYGGNPYGGGNPNAPPPPNFGYGGGNV